MTKGVPNLMPGERRYGHAAARRALVDSRSKAQEMAGPRRVMGGVHGIRKAGHRERRSPCSADGASGGRAGEVTQVDSTIADAVARLVAPARRSRVRRLAAHLTCRPDRMAP